MKFFKPSDFEHFHYTTITTEGAAHLANSKLERESKVVFGVLSSENQFFNTSKPMHPHLLINMETIKKPECNHPHDKISTRTNRTITSLTASRELVSNEIYTVCTVCFQRVVATSWEAFK